MAWCILIQTQRYNTVRDSHVGRGGTGTRYSESNNIEVERVDSVSRWEELENCVAFHVRMASGCWIPTKFLLVHRLESDQANVNQSKFKVCWGRREDVRQECERARDIMRGMTLDHRSCPLAALVRKVRENLAKEAPRLEVEGKKISVVVCTQGHITATAICRRQDSGKSSSSHHSNGGGGVQELRSELEKLSKMPVKIILRMCTDDEEVLEDFNEMDKTIDSVDVLDDFWGEVRVGVAPWWCSPVPPVSEFVSTRLFLNHNPCLFRPMKYFSTIPG